MIEIPNVYASLIPEIYINLLKYLNDTEMIVLSE
jgi:hypothetical protein